MKIIDHTAQPTSERLNTYVGQVLRYDTHYYIIMDLNGRYGWVNLATGHAEVPDTMAGVIGFIEHGTVTSNPTLTIGESR